MIVDRDGAIVLANARVETLFGYIRDELIGQPLEVLVPEWVNHQPTQPEICPLGLGHDLSGRQKDGREFPIEIGLNSLRASEGHLFLASIIDLTERRRAEDVLRDSQRELQLVTRRLLEAQELERRRIARELHDDFNQSLALISVELDILAGSPPESPAEVAQHVRELSARVRTSRRPSTNSRTSYIRQNWSNWDWWLPYAVSVRNWHTATIWT